MYYNYEERIKNSNIKFPVVQDALIEYWNTIYDLTKRIKPENFRKPAWTPIITIDVTYNSPEFRGGLEGFTVKFQSEPIPINSDADKIIKSAIKKILQKVPMIDSLTSNVDITPFLDLTPRLILLQLRGCEGMKEIPDKINLLKELKTLILTNCQSLERLPDSLGSLQELLEIEITICDKLTTLPKSIITLPKLKEVIIRDCERFQPRPEYASIVKIC